MGKLHGLGCTAAWFHSDCNVELHGCTTPGDMLGFALVGDLGWEERGDGDGYFEYQGARFFAAPCLAAIRAADAAMVVAGGVLPLVGGGGGAVGLQAAIASST